MKRKLIILIVDDSSLIIERMTLLLNELENVERVLHACTYEEAKAILEKQDVHAALLDIHLPTRSGIELLRLIREKEYRVEMVMIITDMAGGKNRELCTSLGADYYMDKFDDLEKIETVISGLS